MVEYVEVKEDLVAAETLIMRVEGNNAALATETLSVLDSEREWCLVLLSWLAVITQGTHSLPWRPSLRR